MNTVKRGTYRWMIYKEGDTWLGIALEFNIVVTGEDPRLVELELQEAVIGYLESAKRLKGFRTEQVNKLLNQKTDKEYEVRWTKATRTFSSANDKPVVSPLSDVYKVGIANLATI